MAPTINVSGEAGHKIDCWLAIARQEKIVNLKGLSGYNPPHITSETCMSGKAVDPHKMLARYSSPGKDLQIPGCEWIQPYL